MKISWGQKLSCASGHYLKRWVFDFDLFSVRIHHWLGSDDQRHMHDHPWNFVTIVLKGCYLDISEKSEVLSAGNIRYRKAEHKHSVYVSNPCWTLLLTGPEKRKFGFWVGNKFVKRNKYHFMKGIHPCE